MTTEIIHGAPGSYKSSSLLSLYLLDALKENRTIITNIRGFASIDELNEILFSKPKKTLLNKNPVEPVKSTSEIIVVPHDRDGFQKMATFFHWAPKGAIILMDEGQQVYPSRLTRLTEFDLGHHNDPEWPLTVETAFDKHRHFGWDIYISTTHIAKIHKEIRQVAEYAYRHKNMAGLTGMKGRFKRVQHDPEKDGKTFSHALSTVYSKIDGRVFKLYDSTVTGTTKDIKSGNLLLKSPKFIIVILLLFLSLSVLAYMLIFVPNPLSAESRFEKKAPATHDHPHSSQGDHIYPEKAGVVPSRDVPKRLSNQDNLSLSLISSISYYDGSILYVKDGMRKAYTHFFVSPLGRFTSADIFKMGFKLRFMASSVIIYNDDFEHFVRFGDPNPDYFHPDNNQPVSNSTGQNFETSDFIPDKII